jgi:RHS repeat-associated protein
MREVTFDRGSYNKYKNVGNIGRVKYLDNTRKNVFASELPGPGSEPLVPIYMDLRIDLGAEYTVDGLSFDRYFTVNESYFAEYILSVTLRNSDLSVQEGVLSVNEDWESSNNGQWVTETPSFDPVSNVRYIDIYTYVNWEGWAPSIPEGSSTAFHENLIAVYLDNIQISDQGLSGYPAPNHNGTEFCPICFVSEVVDIFTQLVDIFTGEKHENATDLSLRSAASALSFTRSYRQSKLSDEKYAYMGLGWQHNHNVNLTEDTLASPNTIVVRFTNGSEAHFTKTATNYYEGDPGSVSTITKDGGTGEFTLVTSDKSTYLFDSDGKLLSHVWPNNETWTYTYTGDVLTEVSDGYGRSLQFSYIDDPGQFDDGQLWRVGDHTASGLDGSSPTGRYVEFGYAPEKNDGSAISTPGALLISIQDVRGEVWTYDYYGQHSGEAETDQLNFMTQVASPSVDRTGNGTADGVIQLKNLSYTTASETITGITQQLGVQNAEAALLEIEMAFQPGSENITTETVAGKVTTHKFVQDMYAGTEDPAGNMTVRATDSHYRPTLQQDANGNMVTLSWDGNGKYLTAINDPLNRETLFGYNTSGDSIDTLDYSLDAEGRKTQYSYEDSSNPRFPTRIQVLDTDGTTVLRWQEFEYDSYGRALTETVLDPSDGVTVLQQTTKTYVDSGDGAGLLESVTVEDPLNSGNNTTTTYTYDTFGRMIKTQQSSLFGTCQFSYTVYDEAGNVVATVCGRENTTAPATVNDAIDMYDAGDDIKKDNKVTTHEYDSLGRRVKTTINAGADFAQTTLTVYDALNRVIRTISNYVADVAVSEPYIADRDDFDHGADNTASLVTDTAYNAQGMVRKQVDVLGNATLFGYDDAGRLVKTIQNASDPDYNNDYAGTSPDPTLEAYTEDPAVDADIVSLQAYDAAGNLVKTVDALSRVNYTDYDELNRPVKTVRSAKDDATLDLNPGDVVYEAANDPRAEAYEASAAPDRDLIDLTEYDTMGRVIRTRHLLENRPTAQWDTTLFGFDALGRQARVIRNASQPAYDTAADPSLASYPINPDSDKDILSLTVYEASGRVLYTQDALGNKTWMAYDGLGRQAKTIANAVGTDTDDSEGDPRSDSYVVNSDADKDLIISTIYDSDGRVQSTEDVLGRVNFNVYDASGRLFRTITNYVEQASTDPFDWFWSDANHRWELADDDDTPVSHGTDNDQNIITETIYDAQGRVSQMLDTRRNASLTVYDVLGRRIKSVIKYVEQASTDPADWIWSAGNNRWEDGDSHAIDFGSDNDQNRITTTTYDLGGRVSQTRDAAGIETRYEYDALGRRVSTIVNYVDGSFDAGNPDEDLISITTYNKAGQMISTTDVRETETAFGYDAAGRRQMVTRASTTASASVDFTCYDKAGRVLRTIQNWSNAEGMDSPDAKDEHGNWSYAPETNGTQNDRDLVTSYLLDGLGRPAQIVDPLGHETLMHYDKAGQLLWQSDPIYSITRFVYDQAHRRQRVVQGYLPIPVDERITYFSYPSGNYEIFTMDTDGDNQTNISDTGGQDIHPDWSPDDSQIAFTSDRAGESPTFFYDLYVMDANGDNQERLTDLSGYAWVPTWSPDGGQIAFNFRPGDREESVFDLYVMNADGSNIRLLYSDPEITVDKAQWSPDGQRLAFYGSADNYATGNIYIIHADGTQLVNLTNLEGSTNRNPSWSWDGSKILFQTSRTGNQEIFAMNADGSNPINLSEYSGADDYLPSWSPDGAKIVFHSKRDTANREVYVMDADGSNQTRLTTNTNFNQSPVFSKKVIDPATWSWNGGLEDWEYSESNPIPHGEDNARNIIVDVTYDKASRVIEQQEPRGNLTEYTYDNLNRRKSLLNPLSKEWTTAYSDLEDGGTRVTMTYPGVNEGSSYDVQRDFDRLERLLSIVYGDTDSTPDVTMTYDAAGNRIKLSEFDEDSFAHLSRETGFSYDAMHRLSAVAFDTDGDNTPDETVSYAYDAGGFRTQLTLPGDLSIIYQYDARGRLVSLTDWDDQATQFAYDQANRHILTQRANGLRSSSAYDAAGRLKVLRHIQEAEQLAAPPFTETTILDDFNRSDGSLGANWGGSGTSSFAIDTNQVTDVADDVYWVDERFGADQEVYVTLTSISPNSVDSTEMDLLLKSRSTYNDALIEVFYNPNTEIVQIWTHTPEDDWMMHGDDIPVTFANGDQFGARALRNGTVEVYQNGILLASRDVSSWPHYQDGGYVGMWFINANPSILDDFGGGNLNVSPLTTDVLDDFNRVDGSIGANWSGTPTNFAIDSNQLAISDANEHIYWNADIFGPDQEAYVTFVTLDSANQIDLTLKRQSDDVADGIMIVNYNTYEHRIQIYTYDSIDGLVQRGTDIAVTFEAGDVMGAKARISGDVEVYKNGILWSIQSASDWTFYAEGGYIGLATAYTTMLLEDFGGGNIAEPHTGTTLAHFAYEVDARGNRTQALELLSQVDTSTDTVIAYNDPGLVLTGTWSEDSGFVESTDTDAILKFMFLAHEITLTMGKGPDHSIYDVYVDGALWQSIDGYAVSATQEDIDITNTTLRNEGPHILEIRNQNEQNGSSSDYKVRFKQATVTDKTWDLHTIEYTYDALARLKEARYNPGINTDVLDADLLRRYLCTFDRAGNRTQQSVAVNGGSPTVTNYTYNAANQLTSGGAAYDNNGNLTSDGVNSYTWDRANRLLSMGGVDYQYDGESRRVQQTVSSVVTKYLLDIQPGLAVVLSQTEGSDVTRFVHAPRGIHARQDATNDWHWTVQDGLGTVRVETDNSVAVEGSQNLDPFGNLIDVVNGDIDTPYGFTGELVDGSGLLDLRARRYNAGMGTFASLDPFEGVADSIMSLNRYAYVRGNPINRADATGLCDAALKTSVYSFAEALKLNEPIFHSANGIIPTTMAEVACAAADGIETLAENQQDVKDAITIGGAAYTVSGFALSTAAIAITLTGAALAVGLGMFVYVGLNYPPVAYTPQELEAMRPATPPAPTSTPAPSSTSTPAPSSTPTPAPVPTPSCTSTSTPQKTFYFNALGAYPKPGRTTPTIQQDLQTINHIAGISGMSRDLGYAQQNSSKLPWLADALMGRKFESERAIFFAGRNALTSVTSMGAEIDLVVNNFGTINYVQVKWSDKGMSYSSANKVKNDFQNNPKYTSGSFLLESTSFDAAALAHLVNNGGQQLPFAYP